MASAAISGPEKMLGRRTATLHCNLQKCHPLRVAFFLRKAPSQRQSLGGVWFDSTDEMKRSESALEAMISEP